MENSENRGVRGHNLWCPPRGSGQWPTGPGCAPRSPVLLSKEAALAVSTCWALLCAWCSVLLAEQWNPREVSLGVDGGVGPCVRWGSDTEAGHPFWGQRQQPGLCRPRRAGPASRACSPEDVAGGVLRGTGLKVPEPVATGSGCAPPAETRGPRLWGFTLVSILPHFPER